MHPVSMLAKSALRSSREESSEGLSVTSPGDTKEQQHTQTIVTRRKEEKCSTFPFGASAAVIVDLHVRRFAPRRLSRVLAWSSGCPFTFFLIEVAAESRLHGVPAPNLTELWTQERIERTTTLITTIFPSTISSAANIPPVKVFYSIFLGGSFHDGATAPQSTPIDALHAAPAGSISLPRAGLFHRLPLLLTHARRSFKTWTLSPLASFIGSHIELKPQHTTHGTRQRRTYAKVARHMPHFRSQRLEGSSRRRTRMAQPRCCPLFQLRIQIPRLTFVVSARKGKRGQPSTHAIR